MQRKRKATPHIRFYVVALMFCIETLLFVGLFLLFLYAPFPIHYIWIPILVTVIVNAIGATFIVSTKVNSGYKIAWLSVLTIFPLGGFLIYLLYADKITTKRMIKKRFNPINSQLEQGRVDVAEYDQKLLEVNPRAAKISKYIQNYAHAGVSCKNEFTYFKLGDYAYEPMIAELKKAKRFIFMEYFIIEYGEFFDAIYEVLVEKAKEGVDVRLFYDDFGSVFKVKSFFFKQAEKDGIKCVAFNRCRPFMDIRQNNRDHRKMMIIDGIVGFSGGMNIADEYVNKVERFGLWKDNCFMIKGEAVNDFTNLFLSNYKLIYKKEDINFEKYFYKTNKDLLDHEIKEDGFIQPFGDVPFDNEETARNVYLQMISQAKKTIYLSTPYFVPDAELLNALLVASKSGVEVKIITPGIPDKKLVYAATRSYYSTLAFDGIKVYEYTPGFNHTKMMVVDGEMALTGTINFDYRSLYLHFENGVFISNNSKVSELQSDLEEMVSVSTEIDYEKYMKPNFFKKIYWSILKIFAPLL